MSRKPTFKTLSLKMTESEILQHSLISPLVLETLHEQSEVISEKTGGRFSVPTGNTP